MLRYCGTQPQRAYTLSTHSKRLTSDTAGLLIQRLARSCVEDYSGVTRRTRGQLKSVVGFWASGVLPSGTTDDQTRSRRLPTTTAHPLSSSSCALRPRLGSFSSTCCSLLHIWLIPCSAWRRTTQLQSRVAYAQMWTKPTAAVRQASGVRRQACSVWHASHALRRRRRALRRSRRGGRVACARARCGAC